MQLPSLNCPPLTVIPGKFGALPSRNRVKDTAVSGRQMKNSREFARGEIAVSSVFRSAVTAATVVPLEPDGVVAATKAGRKTASVATATLFLKALLNSSTAAVVANRATSSVIANRPITLRGETLGASSDIEESGVTMFSFTAEAVRAEVIIVILVCSGTRTMPLLIRASKQLALLSASTKPSDMVRNGLSELAQFASVVEPALTALRRISTTRGLASPRSLCRNANGKSPFARARAR